MLTFIAEEIMPSGLALIVYSLVSVLTLIAERIVPIGLALIVYSHVSVLILIADEIVPISLAWIVYSLMSVLTSCTWIDTGLRAVLRVGHLLHMCVYKVKCIYMMLVSEIFNVCVH